MSLLTLTSSAVRWKWGWVQFQWEWPFPQCWLHRGYRWEILSTLSTGILPLSWPRPDSSALSSLFRQRYDVSIVLAQIDSSLYQSHHPFFSQGWSPASSHPLTKSPLSYNNYQPRRVRVNTCSLQDTWSQQTATAAHAALQGSVTNLEKSVIHTLPQTWPLRHLLLYIVSVIDRGLTVYHPFTQRHEQFCSFGSWPQMAVAMLFL